MIGQAMVNFLFLGQLAQALSSKGPEGLHQIKVYHPEVPTRTVDLRTATTTYDPLSGKIVVHDWLDTLVIYLAPETLPLQEHSWESVQKIDGRLLFRKQDVAYEIC